MAAPDAKVQKLTFGSGPNRHTYYLYVPDGPPAQQVPLLVLFHGSGRNGKSLIDPWQPLARAEGVVLLAPDASDSLAWRFPEEGPAFIHDLIESVSAAHPSIDRRRIYLFGHSAGAIQAIDVGVLESEYFAAVAAHAGTLSPEVGQLLDLAPRHLPIAIWVGTRDQNFPVDVVRRTRDLLAAHGFPVQLTEIPAHTHDYYSIAASLDQEAWAFLRQHALASEPKYQEYK